jgi:hypothetical protein
MAADESDQHPISAVLGNYTRHQHRRIAICQQLEYNFSIVRELDEMSLIRLDGQLIAREYSKQNKGRKRDNRSQ